jgi:hypothetical protein
VSADPAQKRLVDLDDYASGHMPDAEAAALEDELFARAASPDGDAEATFIDALTRNAEWLANYFFSFSGGATRAQVDGLLASGRRVHYMDLGGGGGLAHMSAWPEGTQFVVTRLGVDLRGYRDIEVDVSLGDGPVLKTFRGVACDPADGSLYAVCHEPLARIAFQHPRVVARVTAVRDGARETVAVVDARNG